MKMNDYGNSVNKAVLQINWILNLVLVLGYLMEFLKGAKSLGYILTLFMFVFIPLTIASVLYFRNKESKAMKFVTLLGYFMMYTFVMFSADTDRILVFVYMFPIILMYFLYFDLKLMVASCGIALFINILKICYYMFGLHITDPYATTNFTLQIAVVLLYSISVILSTKLSNKFNREQLESIKEETAKQEVILGDVLKIAAILDKNSFQVFEIVEELAATTEVVTKTVAEIAKGSSNTAENIQIQSELTHNIQNIIEDTSGLSENMGKISSATMTDVNAGIVIVNNLSQKAVVVNANSENVFNTMIELKQKSNDIQNITGVITGISEQTSLLSLNAAIESARAGESGKGFAVVADEIRKLAMQSKDSASNIVNIISLLQQKADESVGAVGKLKEVNAEQNALIVQTKEIFNAITSKMKDVNENVNFVNERINQILLSNNKIVNSISEMSALSEEVTASADQASTMTIQNIEKAGTAKKLVEELVETSNEMSKYIR